MTDAVAVDTTTVDEQVSATVTQASPLRVLVDGATVDSSASVLNGATYSLNARVTVAIRNPRPPLVQGTDSGLSV